MGEVFLAQDTKLNRKVAIKFLNEELSRDADKLNRFIQEAKAVSALNHPNILTVYEIGEKDEANFIVTEFIEGRTLREQLSPKQTNSLNQILKIGVQVAEALSAAHQAGIVHRDIKPENIMIRSDGYAKVLDFGLAKLTEQQPKDDVLSEDTTKGLVKTNPGMVMGTVSYMSPEQARGKETDARTDIWSLGVVLYEMLSGKLPFTGETINHTIVSILEREPLLLENVPDELQRIVRKTLTKEVEMRYQTARDLLIDLKNLRRTLDVQGELERSVIPNREITTNQIRENETQIYGEKSIEETKAEDAKQTQNVTTTSSLEYAVIQAKGHKLASAIIGIILLGTISTIVYFGFFAKSNNQIESIAVMPFENRSGNPDSEYLSDGMTETLIKSLSNLPNLNVKARSSVFRYKGKDTDAKTVGRELNVQAVLNGRVVQRGDDLTLSLELIDAATENVIWTENYTRKQSDLVALQSEIARDVSTKLKAKLSGADAAKVEKKYTENPEAYQLYLKGRYQWNKRTSESLKQSVEFFNQAVEKDPNYALAYSGLAESYALFSNYSVALPLEAMPKAKAAALRAIELDDSLAETHVALGIYYSLFAWNQPVAEKQFKRAIELNPNYATAHQQYAIECLTAMKRFDEAVAKAKRAEELDPLSPIIGADLGQILQRARRFDEAIAQLNKVIQLDQNFWVAYWYLGQAYHGKEQYAEAVAAYRKGLALSGDSPLIKALLIRSLTKTGERDEAVKLLGELQAESKSRFISNSLLAIAYGGVGERDKAFAYLEKDIAERGSRPPQIAVSPVWDDLRDDPRFNEMVRRVESSKMD